MRTAVSFLVATHGTDLHSAIALEGTPPCKNPAYRLSTSRRYPPNGGPSPEFVQHAFAFIPQRLHQSFMLEIGGPTYDIDVYRLVRSTDNIVASNHFGHFYQNRDNLTTLGEDFDGEPFIVGDDDRAGPKHLAGKMYKRHGADLHGFADKSYDVVFSSHTLEHFFNPLQALLEWDRVLRPGGHLLLTLPFAPVTFDKFVPPSNMQELLHIYNSGTVLDEDLRRRFEFHLKLFPEDYDLDGEFGSSFGFNMTWNTKANIIRNQVISLCVDESKPLRDSSRRQSETCENARIDETLWHWHVWDFNLLQEVIGDCLGYHIVWMEFVPPYHQYVLAQKPL